MDIDNTIKKFNDSFDNIEINLKNCKIKYKTKNDVDQLYTNFTVFKFFINKRKEFICNVFLFVYY